MNHIVIDLEFDRTDKTFRKSGMPTYFEIIEIGAVKLDGSFNVADRFQSFVRPEMMLKMTGKVRELTGISFEDLTAAPVLADVLESFSEWAGENGSYDIYAWSESDELQISAETEMKGIVNPLSDAQWIDLQAEFNEKIGLERSVSLSNALSWMNIDVSGREHRASDDACNTASVLRMLNDESEMQLRFEPIRRIFNAEETKKSTIGDILGLSLSDFCAACA